jgi:hypothetical protein
MPLAAASGTGLRRAAGDRLALEVEHERSRFERSAKRDHRFGQAEKEFIAREQRRLIAAAVGVRHPSTTFAPIKAPTVEVITADCTSRRRFNLGPPMAEDVARWEIWPSLCTLVLR